MRIIPITNETSFIIGKQGENLATQIHFMVVDEWTAQFGEGTFAVLHMRKGDPDAYPCPVTIDGNAVCWDITNADLASVGIGRAELRYIVNDTIVKSVTYMTRTYPSIGMDIDPPEAWQSWVDEVMRAKAITESAMHDASVSEENASLFADIAKTASDNAKVYAENATDSEIKAKEYSTSAKTAESNAVTSAQTASEASASASESAQTASNAAVLADASATSAVASAETASQAAHIVDTVANELNIVQSRQLVHIDELLSIKDAYVSAVTGALSTGKEGHKVSDFIPVKAGERIAYHLYELKAVATIAFYTDKSTSGYNADLSLIGRGEYVKGIYEVPADGYIRICCRYNVSYYRECFVYFVVPRDNNRFISAIDKTPIPVVSLPYSITDCAWSDDYLVTISPCNGDGYAICTFDISNPVNPVMIAHTDGNMYNEKDSGRLDPATGEMMSAGVQLDPRSVCVENGYVYTAWRGGSGRPFDMTATNGCVIIYNLATLTQVKRIDSPDRISHVAIHHNILYVSRQLNGFTLYDVSTPSNTVELIVFNTGYPSRLYEWQKGHFVTAPNHKTYLVVGGFNRYSYVIDVTQISKESYRTTLNNALTASLTDNNYIVDTDHSYYRIPTGFVNNEWFTKTHHTFDATLIYPYVYMTMSPSSNTLSGDKVLADGRYGLAVANLETIAENPTVEYVEIPNTTPNLYIGDYISNDVEPTGIQVKGDYLYLNNSTKGVAVFNTRFYPDKPMFVGNIPINNTVYGMAQNDNGGIYVTERWGKGADYSTRNYNVWQIV